MRLSLAAAAVVLTAAAVPLVVAAPATATTCDPGSGVSVVVDFKSLGGGVQTVCDAAGGGTKASTLFTRNGFELSYAQRQPGYVCRVEGVPTSDPCVNTSPASAYWGLWWSDGKSGKWTYASLGAQSLTIPAGGSVGFAWDDVDGSVTPGAAPPKQAAASPTPTPTAKPTPTPTVKPSPSVRPTPTPTVTESSTPTPTPTRTSTPTPSETPTPTESTSPSASATPTPTASDTPATDVVEPASAAVDLDDDGLPTWVPIAVIAVLFAGAGLVVAQRRRRS